LTLIIDEERRRRCRHGSRCRLLPPRHGVMLLRYMLRVIDITPERYYARCYYYDDIDIICAVER